MRGLSLLVVCLALPPAAARAQQAAPPAQASDAWDQAREAVARAEARFEAGDFRAAALEFERAHRLLPPGPQRNAVLNNLAVCYRHLHRHADALELFERYLAEADPLPADRREVEAIVEGLRALVGELHVTSNVPAEVWVDDKRRGRTPFSQRLTAGEHVLELRAEGHARHREGLTVEPRAVASVTVELREVEAYRGAPPIYFFTGVGATAASLVTASALGARAVRVSRDANARNEMGTGTATVEDTAHIRRLTIATDVMIATTALLGVGTLVLGFLTDFDAERPAVARRVRWMAGASPRGGSVALGGTF